MTNNADEQFEKAPLPDFVKTISGDVVKKSSLVAAVAFASTFIVSWVVLLLGGIFSNWSYFDFGNTFTGAFQSISLAGFSSLISSSEEGFGGFSIGFVPLFTFTALILSTIFASRKLLTDQAKLGMAKLVLPAIISGLMVALVATIFAAVLPIQTGDAFSEMSQSAASFLSFILLFVFVAVTILLSAGKAEKKWLDKVLEFVPAGTVSTALRHLGALMLVGIIAFLIWVSMGGAFDFWLVLLLLPTAGIWVLNILLLGQIRADMSLLGGAFQQDLGLFSMTLDAWVPWVALLVVLALGLIASMHLAIRRGGKLGTNSDWVKTPIIYAFFGLVLQIFSVFAVSYSGMESFGGASGGVYMAAWSFLIFGLWGLLVEVSSRFVAPYLVPKLPKGVFQFLKKY